MVYKNSRRKSIKLNSKIREIHNYLYGNEGLSEEECLDEIVKLVYFQLFLNKKSKNKLIELHPSRNDFIENFKKIEKEAINFFNEKYGYSEKIKLKNNSLIYCYKLIENINFEKNFQDNEAIIFQNILNSFNRSGRGQYFTPDIIVDLCISLLEPNSKFKILDPAAGSGGFLFRYLEKLENNIDTTKLQEFIENNLYSFEISKKIHSILNLKFLLRYKKIPNSFNIDSLKHVDKYENFFDIIFTNPPFGTKAKIIDKEILQNFDLGYFWNDNSSGFKPSDNLRKNQTPEILFIEVCEKLLKPGGKVVIVLPNGILENSSLRYVREFILNKFNVISVVQLPQETFSPTGTGINTSVVILQKKDVRKKQQNIFYSKITKIGYSSNRDYVATQINTEFKVSSELNNEDASLVLREFQDFNNGINKFKNSYILKSENISSIRLDFKFYNPKYQKLKRNIKKGDYKRLGDLVDIETEKYITNLDKDTFVNYIEISDLNHQYSEITNSQKLKVSELPSRASFQIKTGDLITAVSGNSIGTEKHPSALVSNEFNNSIVTNGLAVIKNFKVSKFYLIYFLNSEIFKEQIYRLRTGAAIPSITKENLENILVPLASESKINKIEELIRSNYLSREKYRNSLRKINEGNL